MQVQKTRVKSSNGLFSRTQRTVPPFHRIKHVKITIHSHLMRKRDGVVAGNRKLNKLLGVVEIFLLAPPFGAFATEPSSGTSGYL